MQEQRRATKLWLQKQFRTSGIQLDPQALEQLVQVVQDVSDPEEFVHTLIDEIQSCRSPPRCPASDPNSLAAAAAAVCRNSGAPRNPSFPRHASILPPR